MIFTKKTKPKSHSTKVLDRLKKSGKHGVFNYELARADIGGLAYHRRITDLRKAGNVIERVRITQGKHKYYLREAVK